MATRIVEGKKPYTGGKAISIDENKVISLNLRDENNLIIYDAGDDEIYVDLQLDDEITPTSAFPIGVNVGRVIVDNGWDKPGTIISAETTSGDNIKIFYADEGTLWIDNGTGTFKQIYFKADVDALLLALRNYIDGELAKKQNGVSSDTAPSNPSEGDLWYDTTSNSMKVWDGTAWQSVGTGGGGSDIEYVTQEEYNALLPGAESDGKHYFIYSTSGGGGWQPGVNTIAYYKLDGNANDYLGNYNGTWSGTSAYKTLSSGIQVAYMPQSNALSYIYSSCQILPKTVSFWFQKENRYDDGSGTTDWVQLIGQCNSESGNWQIRFNELSASNNYLNLRNSSGENNIGGLVPNFGNTNWHNIVLTLTNGDNKLYYDGSLFGTLGGNCTVGGNLYMGGNPFGYNGTYKRQLAGCMSEVILEDKNRTAQEVSDYYNQTKANYGIS